MHCFFYFLSRYNKVIKISVPIFSRMLTTYVLHEEKNALINREKCLNKHKNNPYSFLGTRDTVNNCIQTFNINDNIYIIFIERKKCKNYSMHKEFKKNVFLKLTSKINLTFIISLILDRILENSFVFYIKLSRNIWKCAYRKIGHLNNFSFKMK